MARTLDDIRASRPQIDTAKLRRTTEADIRRHMIEDDSAPAAALTAFVKRKPGQRGAGKRPAKVQMTLRIDPAAYEAWKRSWEGYLRRAAEVLAREAPRGAAEALEAGTTTRPDFGNSPRVPGRSGKPVA